MGNGAAKAAVPADALQAALVAARRRPRAARAVCGSNKEDDEDDDDDDAEEGKGSTEGLVQGLPRATQEKGRFVIDRDVFTDFPDPATLSFLKWRKNVEKIPATPSAAELDRLLPVRAPDAKALAAPPADQMQATWLGHASVLSQWDGWNVLADPIFSHRCSPVQFMGPARIRPR